MRRETEEDFKLLEDLHALVVVLDAQGTVRWWNAACTLLTGCRLEQVRGHLLWQTPLVADRTESLHAAFSAACAGEPARVEATARKALGERCWITWSCAPLTSPGGPDAYRVWTGLDITGHKRLEDDLGLEAQALRRSDERFRAIFNHTFQFIGLLSPDGTLLEANASALRFGGLERSQVVGRPFWEARWWTLTPRTQERLRQAIAEASQGRFVRYEADVLGADGQVATIDFSLNPVFEEGRVTYIVPEGRDITDRLRMEEALRRSEARFAGIFAITADATLAVDEHQRIRLFNDGAEATFGYTRSEVVGAPLDMLLPERHREAHRQHLERFGKGPAQARHMGGRGEVSGRRKNGEQFPLEACIARLGEGPERLYIVSLRDVTERHRIEREQRFLAAAGALLAESIDYEATLRQVARLAVPDLADSCVVYLRTPEGRVEIAAVEHVEPHQAGFLQEVRRRYPVRLDAPSGAGYVIRTGQSELVREVSVEHLRALATDEEHHRLVLRLGLRSYICVPLCARGEVLGAILLLMVEQSQRRQGPEDLALAQELARRAALAIDNARLYRTAQEATRARDEMLGVVAHDLRNPLHAILLQAHRLGRKLKAAMLPEPVQGVVSNIEVSVRRMDRLVEDLLTVTRMDSGRLLVRPTRESPETLVNEALGGARPLAERHELRVVVGSELPQVLADKDRVLQVFSNLLGNALKFTPLEGSVEVGAALEGTHVCFWVRDSGPGIPPEHQPRVFDRFWQADARDKRGAGLGLAICKGLVEAHGGRIWVESTPGEGSSFRFTLPVASASLEEMSA
ncbi:PAS domain S-box-containing protein [Archangium gephyra]|uniref:histidine kinase n=1 Tax=Archangium gephyra TaxID=48 RepID=A0AAC8QBR5_9BACT|nr:PAS domain S-box protein [Archangium gephyra]AKJ04454.1 Sensory transduction histidine kinase [Archangium gephyra]REG37473.1 PAS domain S-box-containing protein [Archangium gephyra]